MNHQTKLVSIILPVYNAEKFIQKTVQCILNQTYKNFELIIINDCSTDRSLQILSTIEDRRIRLISNEKNLRLIKTLNKGIELSIGSYIARCDADDLYDLTRIEKQVRFLDEHQDVGVVGTDAWLIGESGSIIGTTYNFPKDSLSIDIRLSKGSPFFHPSVMIRRELFEKYGKYDEQYLHVEDYALWLKYFPHTYFVNLDEKLLKYRVHANSITGQNHTMQVDNAQLARDIFLKGSFNYDYVFRKWMKLPSSQVERAILRESIWKNKNSILKLFEYFSSDFFNTTICSSQLLYHVVVELIKLYFQKLKTIFSIE